METIKQSLRIPQSILVGRLLLFGMCILLIGCSNMPTSSQRSQLVEHQGLLVLGAPAGHLTVSARDSNSREHLCLGRLPDSVMSRGVDIGLNSPGVSGLNFGNAANDLGLGGRNPAVLMVREYFYRMCELQQNYNLSREQALALFRESYPILAKALSSATPGTQSVGSVQSAATPNSGPGNLSLSDSSSGDNSSSNPSTSGLNTVFNKGQ